MESTRTDNYLKNNNLEILLRSVNNKLSKMHLGIEPEGHKPRKPIIFVVGIQRSGSTLLMQLLTHYFQFTYPDNITARFWRSPHLGILISKSLQHQFKQQSVSSFLSDYGVTNEPFAPHEFGYFWSHYFGFEPVHQLTQKQLGKIDLTNLKRDLFLMEYFGENPLLFKAIPLSFNSDFLAKIFPNALFINITRSPLHIAASTFKARIERFGDSAVWWSLKPNEYGRLLNLPPLAQVAGQIIYSLKRVKNCLDSITPEKKTEVSYESLCTDPIKTLEDISKFFGNKIQKKESDIPRSFNVQKKFNLDAEELNTLEKYLNEFNR